MDSLTPPRMIQGSGTSEQHWQNWFGQNPLRQQDLLGVVGGGSTAHIVAPHPDDEVLGCAGIIQQISRSGCAVCIWAVTDGEASHAESPSWTKEVLAKVRTKESEQALAMLCSAYRRTRLAIPDGAVTRYEDELGSILAASFNPGDIVFAPWDLDGHPDHEAVSRASRRAAELRQCRFLEIPIWGWHWADPYMGNFPLHRAVAIMLTPEEQRVKYKAIQAFQSQLQPDHETGKPAILPDYALARLLRPYEVLLR